MVGLLQAQKYTVHTNALVTGQLGINVQARSFHTRPGIRVIMCLVSVMLFKKIGLKKSF
jgi:hypothetical protein